MNDATGNTTRDTTDRATRHDGVTVNEAAVALGISPDSVRARLRRGSLAGEKQGTTWMVHLDPSSARDEDGRRATRHDTPRDATRHDTTARDRPTIDLAPLVSHIATLEDQVQRLAESNTLWQVRARQAEEQLKQLTAGNVAPETAPELPGSSPANDRGTGSVWTWVKRAWRG